MVLSIERFVGKVAVVTGASSGIGAGIVEALVSNGLIVAGLGRRVEAIESLAQKLAGSKGKLIAFKCDMTKEDEIVSTLQQIISKLGPISVLINNAGLSRTGSLINGDPKSWKTVLETNVLGLCIATKQAIQNMIANQTLGHIIHINSVVGHTVMNIPGFDMYGPSKYAVTALAETLRLEINREKLQIKITSVSPGYVKTNFEFPINVDNMLGLESEDVADAVIYALSTPPHVNVSELSVRATGSL
ncbi:farnesol dehydrogenase-like isoform X1 [Dendroctonus ponderosae]|uniref:Farnesol dehydrogenase-like n=1 Tax=Dendroctonus ponderosae TaxID=77166 RepID=J3JZE7_DENPD|nr:farnesol dehydrogenase-like isoform X1 [Dendroctonus ponderosae]AEE63585.1 unknown [Dendroctonus ponderosae]